MYELSPEPTELRVEERGRTGGRMSLPLIPTTLVGSYVQPDWLVDRAKLGGMAPPRVRAREVWRVAEAHLEEAQDAATLAAIRKMERAGLDILGLTVFGLFMGLMAWQATGVFTESVRNSSVTLSIIAWPLRYPQFLWVVGLWWFVVVALLLWTRAVLTIVRGNFIGVQLQIGSRTVHEEIKDELRQIDERGEEQIKKPGDV